MPAGPWKTDAKWHMDTLAETIVPLMMQSDSPTVANGTMIYLNVYDINEAMQRWSPCLVKVNLGAFHCGVEVLDDEWFFAWGEGEYSGVVWNEPKCHQVHIFRETVCMGESPLSQGEIRMVVTQFMDTWIASSYHPVSKNCVNFAEELLLALRVPTPFPRWVRGAMDVGNSCCLRPLATCSWYLVRKWYDWNAERMWEAEFGRHLT
mmetsp:Transcript_10162/g.22076  ORF Transcript_10162/g.22076 Transcript_10162/m.22076 type:complete len:206 (+) Transcript_10162:71-688(+)